MYFILALFFSLISLIMIYSLPFIDDLTHATLYFYMSMLAIFLWVLSIYFSHKFELLEFQKDKIDNLPKIETEALSLIFLDREKIRTIITQTLLFFLTIPISYIAITNKSESLFSVSIIPGVIIIFLYLRYYLIKIRVYNGLFGTNKHEAKILIQFICKVIKKKDFTDSSGGKPKVLLKENISVDLAKEILGSEVYP